MMLSEAYINADFYDDDDDDHYNDKVVTMYVTIITEGCKSIKL